MKHLQGWIGIVILSSVSTIWADTLTPIVPRDLPAMSRESMPGAVKGKPIDLQAQTMLENAWPPALSGVPIARVLSTIQPDKPGMLRGAKEAAIYRAASPAVVLVATKDGIGSGVLISSAGDIITNWHVVANASEVAVFFKPIVEGSRITRNDARPARVLRVDQVADLALLRVSAVPTSVRPLPLGSMDEIEVGADVHAIGHPTGESWTYTKGVVSQIRRDYSWTASTKLAHQASVIQTQTPINPGNSGGPLIGDSGRVVGINSFKSAGAEGLNFAVTVDEVRSFLNRSGDRYAAVVPASPPAVAATGCKTGELRELYERVSEDGSMNVTGYDADCDGLPDLELRLPKDKARAAMLVFDINKDSKPDIVVFDLDRDGKWDRSFHDTDYDGKWDLVGFHPDGTVKASRFERYDTWVAQAKR
jgi:S1-C subfamily serine protease